MKFTRSNNYCVTAIRMCKVWFWLLLIGARNAAY